jgi:hypothetical protein
MMAAVGNIIIEILLRPAGTARSAGVRAET